MPTRVAILSDTHLRAGRELPDAAADLIAGADLAIHGGDVSDLESWEAMEAIGTPLHGVHGNVDTPEVVDRLAETITLGVEDARISVIHDSGQRSGRLERMRRRFPGSDAVVFGHSHIPLHESADGFQIFNPGSPTQRRRSPTHTMGIAEVSGSEVRFTLVDLRLI